MANSFLEKVASVKWFSGYLEYWALGYCCVGAIFMCASMFIPRWRVDTVGTQPLEAFWLVSGFQQRQYGLLQVRGSFSQSWKTLAKSSCDWRDLGLLVNIGETIGNFAGQMWDVIKNGDMQQAQHIKSSCQGSESCANGFAQHTWDRCHEYNKMHTLSMITIGLTFLSVLLCLSGAFVAALTNIKQTGGVVFGLFCLGSIFALGVSITYAAVTDYSFKKLAEDAYFPYPSLAIGWFLHLYGGIILAVASGVFGSIVLPITWAYDPEQEKIDKRNRRLQKLKANQPQHYVGVQPVVAAMNFPLPPGIANPAYLGAHPAQALYGEEQFGMDGSGAMCGGGLVPQPYGHTQLGGCAPQAHAPQSYAPQAYAQQAYAPQAYAPQAAAQGRWSVKMPALPPSGPLPQ